MRLLLVLTIAFIGCKKDNMENAITSWDRDYYEESEQKPFIFFTVYGSFPENISISSKLYRCQGVSKGITLQKYSKHKHSDFMNSFFEGYLWDELQEKSPVLTDKIKTSPELIVLSGEPEIIENLNYLRDCVGVITYLLDNGGVCVYDPQMIRWWTVDEWKSKIFEHGKPMPWNHVVILLSEENKKLWIHTRGMRKFGRPDLSMHDVVQDEQKSCIEMIERFIALQAYGAVVKEGQEIRMDNIPAGTKCFPQGSLDDYDFNNYHIEIKKP